MEKNICKQCMRSVGKRVMFCSRECRYNMFQDAWDKLNLAMDFGKWKK